MEATPQKIYSYKGSPGTELAGVAAKEGAGCQALVVGVYASALSMTSHLLLSTFS